MKQPISWIVIQGFRSIEYCSIECGQCNVFSGTNDSGKSNVLRALNLFFNKNTDFQQPLKFTEDYNKVALARAIRSTKMKQQIKIRIYLNVPNSYSSLADEGEVFLERSFDRYGNMTEKFSNDEKRAKASITRLINQIQYIYIPALKGENVLRYMLGLIGSFELIGQDEIATLNESVSSKTNDLVEILKDSKVPVNTSFGFPVLLEDFWSRLSVNSDYDRLRALDESIRSKKEENNRALTPSLFQIPLSSRGEGIKSMYIPPLLQWLDDKSPKTYLWGIDEPENSLEFSQSERLADLYYGDYSKKNQIFLTSHSLAFINPKENVKTHPKRFRCTKNELGSTQFIPFEGLLERATELDLYSDLGILEAQKSLIDDYRQLKDSYKKKEKEIGELYKSISEDTKPLLLTEGKSDAKIISEAWSRLYPDKELPLDVIHSGADVDPEKRSGGADQVRQSLTFIGNLGVKKTIVGLFDNDHAGNLGFKGLDKNAFEPWDDINIPVRKHLGQNTSIFGMLLPPPDNREVFVSRTNYHHRYFEIELS